MNSYPFEFKTTKALGASDYGRKAMNMRCKISKSTFGADATLAGLYNGQAKFELNIRHSGNESEFFYQSKHMSRQGLPELNDVIGKKELPDNMYELKVNMAKELRQFYEDEEFQKHALFFLSVDILYLKISVLRKVADKLLHKIRLMNNRTGIEFEWVDIAFKNHQAYLVLHAEGDLLTQEMFFTSIEMMVNDLKEELKNNLGTAMDIDRSKRVDSREIFHVYVEEDLQEEHYVNDLEDKQDGEEVLWVTINGLTVGVEVRRGFEDYRYLAVFSKEFGKKKIILDEMLSIKQLSLYELFYQIETFFKAEFNLSMPEVVELPFYGRTQLELNQFEQEFDETFSNVFTIKALWNAESTQDFKGFKLVIIWSDEELNMNPDLKEKALRKIKTIFQKALVG